MNVPRRAHLGPVRLALCGLALFVAIGGTARADGPVLTVTNLGQPSAPVEVAQSPLTVGPTADCAHPFTLAGESACPPGTWPPLGQQWGPIENVAGGDTLRLEFATPVLAVKVGSTSNYPPGLADPDGKAVSNYDVISESSALATSDPRVWLTTLPALDARAISSHGYTFSVVAEDPLGYHDYPFGIRSPRYANESTKCGTAYYSTGWSQYLCPSGGKALPPALGPVSKPHKKRRCRKGFRRRKVRSKMRCVRVKKQRQGHRH